MENLVPTKRSLTCRWSRISGRRGQFRAPRDHNAWLMKYQRTISLVGTVVLLVYACGNRSVQADPPAEKPVDQVALHARIDQLLASKLPYLTAPRSEEGLLLRRLSLDTRGVVPTGEELQAFIEDKDPHKWQVWVKKFMSDPLHREAMVNWLDKTLMQRRAFTNVKREEWLAWLRGQVDAAVPLDKLIANMLSAPWWENSQRAALRFFLDRAGDPHLINRDLGRVLLGRDLQCAQCHDHPLVEEYRQVDYHGLLAFVNSSSLIEATYKDEKGADQKTKMYVERPGSDAPFESVFDKGVALRSGPRLPVDREIFEEYLEPDARLTEPVQAGALAGVPKSPIVSRRAELAQALLVDHPQDMARNFANRLWALAFGRGLVHPLDMHHADNPAVHPELLNVLTEALLSAHFKLDELLEQLFLSESYCRSSEIYFAPWPIAAEQSPSALAAEIAEIEQAAQSLKASLANRLTTAQQAATDAEAALETKLAAWRAAQVARNAVQAELDKAEATFNEAKKKSDAAAAAHTAAVAKHQAANNRAQLLEEAAGKIQQALGLGTDDAELKQAMAVAKAKSDAAKGELAGLEKAAKDAANNAATLLAAIDSPRAKIKESASALAAEHKKLDPIDAEYAQARSAWAKCRSELLVLEQAQERHEHVLSWTASLAGARRLEATRATAVASVVALQAELASVEKQTAQANEVVLASEKQHAAKVVALTAARQLQVEQATQVEQLREAKRQIEKVVALVAETESLAAAAKTLETTLSMKLPTVDQYLADVQLKEQQVQQAAADLERVKLELRNIQVLQAATTKKLADAQANQEMSQVQLEEGKQAVRDAWQIVLSDQRLLGAAGNVRALSPEQLGASILRVTGVLNNHVQSELAELQKKEPLAEDADASVREQRTHQATRQAIDKLRGNIDVFANLFSSGIGQTADEFFASPDQALYMSNAGPVFSWSGPNGQNITQRVIAQADSTQACADLFGTLLARQPTTGELSLVTEQLSQAGDKRPVIVQEMVWGILTGVEFRFVR